MIFENLCIFDWTNWTFNLPNYILPLSDIPIVLSEDGLLGIRTRNSSGGAVYTIKSNPSINAYSLSCNPSYNDNEAYVYYRSGIKAKFSINDLSYKAFLIIKYWLLIYLT